MKEAIVLLGSANSSGVVWAGVFLSGYLVRSYVGFLRRHPPLQADLLPLRELVRRQQVQQRCGPVRRRVRSDVLVGTGRGRTAAEAVCEAMAQLGGDCADDYQTKGERT